MLAATHVWSEKRLKAIQRKVSDIKNEHTGFECAEQVAALLNCIAERSYNEMKCIPLLKKLRTCVEKKVSLLVRVRCLPTCVLVSWLWILILRERRSVSCVCLSERCGLHA